MDWLIEHAGTFIFCCSFPLLGWIQKRIVSKKEIIFILFTSLIFLLPALTGYRYLNEFIYPILIWTLLSSIYAIIIKEKNKSGALTIKLSALTLVLAILLTVPFILGAGQITVDQEWEIKGYKVKHVIDQGFAGRAAIRYELYQYGTIPMFIKMVDSKMDNDTTGNCTVKFGYKNISFNKCNAYDK
ncbi:hypothetical protein FHW88_001201 [Mucilaginibacter sp. SG538B]|uniref:hypothetical protein n=1 Tax=Mucilaginibacter sp. SG538B TaxID=2587021 RepID=UPI00159D3AB2|nr:hypothetical protein [Mucilaginibacter sp. SG538B]NVM62925.1 hypothetical protein [Mucilaginibacter sp. SG538B]